jgi:bifunctional enzyme CysN/CysC
MSAPLPRSPHSAKGEHHLKPQLGPEGSSRRRPARDSRGVQHDRSGTRDVRRGASHGLATVWLTGLSGAGKTTIARAVEKLIGQIGFTCRVLDGDELRRSVCSDLGLSRDDRREHARRVACIAATLAEAGVLPIVALISPHADDRRRARTIHEAAGLRFVEVWVDTPIGICQARDPKGLYAKAAAVEATDRGVPSDGSGLTGVAAPYEAPADPDLRVAGYGQHPLIAAKQILAATLPGGLDLRCGT